MSRVLYVSADPGVPVLGHKGASVHVRALATAFAALGHEVTLASPRIEPAENTLPAAIDLAQLPAVVPKTAPDAVALAEQAAALEQRCVELARERQPDLVYERYALATAGGAAVREFCDAPLVVEVNAPLRVEAARFRTLRHEQQASEAERRLFDAADSIFAVSSGVADWLVAEGTPLEKIEIVPNAFPEQTFPDTEPVAADRELVVGFAGGMKAWHGIDVLLEATQQAIYAGARIKLELVGNGPADDLIDAARLPADRLTRIRDLPHAETLRRLQGWDVGVAPFRSLEGFWFSPLKLYEYMAAGLCPIVSDVGELPRIVGDAGVVVAADDSDALAQALITLDRDRARVSTLALAAQERARSGPTWRDTARRALAVGRVARMP